MSEDRATLHVFVCPACGKQYDRTDGMAGISLGSTFCSCRAWGKALKEWTGWKRLEVVTLSELHEQEQALGYAEAVIEEWQQRADRAEEALRPFAELLERARALGHTSGSSCTWRMPFDDLVRAREALASHPKEPK